MAHRHVPRRRSVRKRGKAKGTKAAARLASTRRVLGERFPVRSPADLLAHPVLPPPPTADMTAAQRAARVREITIAALAWLADIPDSAIQNDDELQNLVDPVAYQSLSGELARGLRLTKGEEAALYGGLVNDKWDTVADLASYLIKVVEKHFGSRSGRSA